MERNFEAAPVDLGVAYFEWSLGGRYVTDGQAIFEMSIGHIAGANGKLFHAAAEAVKRTKRMQETFMVNEFPDRLETRLTYQSFSIIVITQMVA